MNEAIKNLIELQSLEFEETISASSEKRVEALRAIIPGPILNRYDHWGDQGKKGVAALRQQVCTGCHLTVPVSTRVELLADRGIPVCNNCGRFLYLQSDVPEHAPKKKVSTKTNTRQLAHAA
jgi:predicted  nucleic acid-binding Zn-ribbon protein